VPQAGRVILPEDFFAALRGAVFTVVRFLVAMLTL
jgi:hypothetical protein